MKSDLVRIDPAIRALADAVAAKDIRAILKMRDTAEAARVLFGRREGSLDCAINAAELVIRCNHGLGAVLPKKSTPVEDGRRGGRGKRVPAVGTLSVPHQRASEWRRFFEGVPETRLNVFLQTCRRTRTPAREKQAMALAKLDPARQARVVEAMAEADDVDAAKRAVFSSDTGARPSKLKPGQLYFPCCNVIVEKPT